MPVLLFVLIAIVVLAVVGIAALGLVLKLVWWSLVGLVIGLLGRFVASNESDIGLGTTILGGIAAALLGGVIANALDLGGFLEFLIAIIVAGLGVWFFYCAGDRSVRS
mgnify:CR=1 FL=1